MIAGNNLEPMNVVFRELGDNFTTLWLTPVWLSSSLLSLPRGTPEDILETRDWEHGGTIKTRLVYLQRDTRVKYCADKSPEFNIR